jgi:hypothetical protein
LTGSTSLPVDPGSPKSSAKVECPNSDRAIPMRLIEYAVARLIEVVLPALGTGRLGPDGPMARPRCGRPRRMGGAGSAVRPTSLWIYPVQPPPAEQVVLHGRVRTAAGSEEGPGMQCMNISARDVPAVRHVPHWRSGPATSQDECRQRLGRAPRTFAICQRSHAQAARLDFSDGG